MTGIEIIGLVGAIASIIGIPTAFYFERRKEVKKFEEVRRRILETLMHQIGSGQKIDSLGTKLIIDSKLREAGLKAGRISMHEVIADLYTNVTINPLLDTKQKSIYQGNIKRLGLSYQFNNAIQQIKDSKKLPSGEEINTQEIAIIEESSDERKIEFMNNHRLLKLNQESYLTKRKSFLKYYSYFASLLSILAVFITLFSYAKFSNIDFKYDPKLLILIFSGLMGIVITIFSSVYSVNKERRTKNDENTIDFIQLNDDE